MKKLFQILNALKTIDDRINEEEWKNKIDFINISELNLIESEINNVMDCIKVNGIDLWYNKL